MLLSKFITAILEEVVLILKQLRSEDKYKELHRLNKYTHNDIFFLPDANSIVNSYCLEASFTPKYAITRSSYFDKSDQSFAGYQRRNHRYNQAATKDYADTFNIYNIAVYRIVLSILGAFRNNTPFITDSALFQHLRLVEYRIFNVLLRHLQTDYHNMIPYCILQCSHQFLNRLGQGFRYVKIKEVVNSLLRFAIRNNWTARISHLNISCAYFVGSFRYNVSWQDTFLTVFLNFPLFTLVRNCDGGIIVGYLDLVQEKGFVNVL